MTVSSNQQPGVAAGSQSAIAAIQMPNLYQLQGHGVSVTYSVTSFGGKPLFHYQDMHQTLNFEGDEIRTIDLEIGMLVSVTLRLTADAGSTTFSVLLPNVNLVNSQQAHIRTEGITTVQRFSLIPILNRGQTQFYSVIGLTGTAMIVQS